eukprot:m.263973 g.263973  ORF g.263973 m.263973 type:complete len:307 (+) comp22768_c1_seq1:1684-2604(+)
MVCRYWSLTGTSRCNSSSSSPRLRPNTLKTSPAVPWSGAVSTVTKRYWPKPASCTNVVTAGDACTWGCVPATPYTRNGLESGLSGRLTAAASWLPRMSHQRVGSYQPPCVRMSTYCSHCTRCSYEKAIRLYEDTPPSVTSPVCTTKAGLMLGSSLLTNVRKFCVQVLSCCVRWVSDTCTNTTWKRDGGEGGGIIFFFQFCAKTKRRDQLAGRGSWNRRAHWRATCDVAIVVQGDANSGRHQQLQQHHHHYQVEQQVLCNVPAPEAPHRLECPAHPLLFPEKWGASMSWCVFTQDGGFFSAILLPVL